MGYPLLKVSDELDSPFSSSLFSTSTVAANSNYEVTNVVKSWIFDYNLTVNTSASTNLVSAATGGTASQTATASLSSAFNLANRSNQPDNLGKLYPTFVSSGNASGGTASASVLLPTVLPGQIIFLFLGKTAVATYNSQPTGFTSVGTALQVSGSANSGSVWYKVADGTESGTAPSASWTTNATWLMAYAIYNNPSPTTPINAVTSQVFAASGSQTLPSVTSTVGYTEAMYVSMPFLSATTEATTFAAGPVKEFDYASSTAGINIALADKTNGTVGTASGTNSITTNDSCTNLAWTIALAGVPATPVIYSESSAPTAASSLTADATVQSSGNPTTGSGSLSLTASATDSISFPVTASGSISITGSTTDSVTFATTGSGALSLTATGSAQLLQTSGSGSISLTGSATDSVQFATTASGALSLTGSATDSVTFATTGSGALDVSGTATDSVKFATTASGALFLTGNANTGSTSPTSGTGSLSLAASGTASLKYTESASGSISLTATASASITYSTTGAGTITVVASGTDSLLFVDAGSGFVTIVGSGTGTFTAYTGTGSISLSGTATGTFAYSGFGTATISIAGSANAALAPFPVTATGSISINGVANDYISFTTTASGALVLNAFGSAFIGGGTIYDRPRITATIAERLRIGAIMSGTKTTRIGASILGRPRSSAGITNRERTASTITRRTR